MFSRIVYSLALLDAALISAFFYRLSMLNDGALKASVYIDFSFWVDYLVWIIITVILPVYLHYFRYDFKNEFTKLFKASYTLHSKIAASFFCDLLPIVALTAMFFRVSNWLLFNTGPS